CTQFSLDAYALNGSSTFFVRGAGSSQESPLPLDHGEMVYSYSSGPRSVSLQSPDGGSQHEPCIISSHRGGGPAEALGSVRRGNARSHSETCFVALDVCHPLRQLCATQSRRTEGRRA